MPRGEKKRVKPEYVRDFLRGMEERFQGGDGGLQLFLWLTADLPLECQVKRAAEITKLSGCPQPEADDVRRAVVDFCVPELAAQRAITHACVPVRRLTSMAEEYVKPVSENRPG